VQKDKNKILITGAGGLVGSHLAQALVQKGEAVKALYRSTIPQFELSDKIEWCRGDILDISSLQDAMNDIKHVYHCAAVVSFAPKQKKLLYKTNVEGTANVVNISLDCEVEKLLYVSSVSAIGRLKRKEPITEKMQWSEEYNSSEYGRTKYYAEMEVWRSVGEGLSAVIVNPTIILGAADWSKGSSAIFRNVYNEFPWYTEGVTGFVDVEDVVKAMIMLMENGITAQRFILNAINMSYGELFSIIAKTFGKKPPYKKVNRFIAEFVWRAEALKSKLNNTIPLITKETALTAQAKAYFDNSKLLKFLPQFQYASIQCSIERICSQYKEMYHLT
jgi:dihydroflavonol-4-reductase